LDAGPLETNLISGQRRPNSRFTRLPSTSANASTGRYLDFRADPAARIRPHGKKSQRRGTRASFSQILAMKKVLIAHGLKDE
jgi:hypothetical protein